LTASIARGDPDALGIKGRDGIQHGLRGQRLAVFIREDGRIGRGHVEPERPHLSHGEQVILNIIQRGGEAVGGCVHGWEDPLG